MSKVTVIIPAYNAERYIYQCLESVINQTLDDIDIIVIDDGSTDKTGEIIEEIAGRKKNVQVVHQENKGLYRTREIGLKMATGDYVGWVDADDFIDPTMFETLYKAAVRENSELVICDYSWFPEGTKTKGKWFRKYQGKVDVPFVERNSQPWNKIVKRELFGKLNIEEKFSLCHDEIYICVLMKAKNPVTLDKPLYHYRVSDGTMSSSYTNLEHYNSFITASKNLKSVMESIVSDSYWKDYFDYRVIYYMLMTMIVAANSNNKEAYKVLQNQINAIHPRYSKNQHFWRVLKDNYGRIKMFAIGVIIPMNFSLARLVCKIGLR